MNEVFCVTDSSPLVHAWLSWYCRSVSEF